VITSAEIQGFKRFFNERFDIAPLTVLTGLNGSGKSTLIQALLLAQEASANQADSVRLNGPYGMELGTAEDVLNWDSRGPIRIELQGPKLAVSKWQFQVPTEDAMYLDIDQSPADPLTPFSGKPRAFTYLSAERLGPRSLAATSPLPQSDLEVGMNGEYCAHVLSVLGDAVIEYEERSHPLYRESSPRLLKYEVEQWLSEIARPVEINGERLAASTVAELRFRVPGSTWVRSTNMGFGVTYVLPIVLAGLIARRDGLLIVENPEAHLHPTGQSRMGVFLAWLAGRGIQILVETHSDHVLNGVRRGVAEFGYLPPSSALVHWFGGVEADDEQLEVTTLRIGKSGTISDWPKGFFDQYQIDVSSLGRIRRARR
jgi:predicted ATPase